MGFPLAVAPSIRSPGLYLLVNLLAGIASPGTNPYRGLIIAEKSAAGTITADNQVVHAIAGADDAKTWLGPGIPGHLAAKRTFEEFPLAQIDLVAPLVPGGVVATGTITFTIGTPPVTAARTVTIKVCGRTISVTWNPGDSVTTIAANCVLAINALAADLPVVASNVAGVLTLTFKIAGTIGNDCTFSVVTTGGAPSDAIGTASGATLTGGTLAPDLTNVLTLIGNSEYDLILDAASDNTDAASASGTTTVSKLQTSMFTHQSGLNAKLQQAIVGFTGTLSNAKTGTAFQNVGWLQYIFGNAFLSMPAELGASEFGARLREETLDPAVNRIEMEYVSTLYPPADLTTGALTAVQIEDSLLHGVTPVDYNAQGQPRPKRPITTYFADTASNPDDRLLDTSRITGTFAFAKDLRINVPIQFKGAKLSPDLPPTADPPAPKTVEVRDIKEFVLSRAYAFVSKGTLLKQPIDDAVANGSFMVQVDPSDPSQCDIVIPEKVVPPLAKFSLVLNHIGT